MYIYIYTKCHFLLLTLCRRSRTLRRILVGLHRVCHCSSYSSLLRCVEKWVGCECLYFSKDQNQNVSNDQVQNQCPLSVRRKPFHWFALLKREGHEIDKIMSLKPQKTSFINHQSLNSLSFPHCNQLLPGLPHLLLQILEFLEDSVRRVQVDMQ